MQNAELRTDLALEEKESFEGDGGEVCGVVLEEEFHEATETKITRVLIKDEAGAKAMRKPIGSYITLESNVLIQNDEAAQMMVSEELAKYITDLMRGCTGTDEEISVLVVGLGNREVTSDSLGPRVLEHLLVTRHLGYEDVRGISGIIPGVMAQTGMETAEIVKGIVKETKPKLVIVIDALAARSVSRLATTIQLTDTGIQPGSGVGNHRHSLTKETLGIPVIAIGVPTVVGAAAIVYDTAEAFSEALKAQKSTREAAEVMDTMSTEEKYQLIRELIEPKLGPMFVTPKDIDEKVRQLSLTISEGINLALLPA